MGRFYTERQQDQRRIRKLTNTLERRDPIAVKLARLEYCYKYGSRHLGDIIVRTVQEDDKEIEQVLIVYDIHELPNSKWGYVCKIYVDNNLQNETIYIE